MSGWEWDIDGWVLLVGLLSALSCALLGNYLVLRRMSLMGDAISHAVLPGLAIAFLITESRSAVPMFAGAVAAGTLTAVLSETVRRLGKVEHGAAMGVIFSVLFAVGLVLIRQATDHVDLDPECVLYGNIVQIPLEAVGGEVPPAVVNLSIVLVINLLFVVCFYKELKVSAFDPELATTLGINAKAMHYALMILVSVTAVANFESVGSILVIAMLIVPAAAAHLLADRLGIMILFSLLLAAASAVFGQLLAGFGPGWLGYSVSANTAATMVVVAGALLVVVVLFAPENGVFSRLAHRARLGMTIVIEDILGLLHRWEELRPPGRETMPQSAVLDAVGDDRRTRRGLRALVRGGLVVVDFPSGGAGDLQLRLSPSGRRRAAGLIRSHRLWEAYLERHFSLPLDHLHLSAERVEHYISPTLRDELTDDLTAPSRDPHGREIPSVPPPKSSPE